MILFTRNFVDEILSGTKNVTRRMRKQWKVGSYQQCRVNYNEAPFAYVKIVGLFEEKLSDMTDEEITKMGFDSRNHYVETYRQYFPHYDGVLYRYRFETVTKREYEAKSRILYPTLGSTVKLIIDGDTDAEKFNARYRVDPETGKDLVLRTVSQVITLMHGVKVVHLDKWRGYYDIEKLYIVILAPEQCATGSV